MSDSAGRDRYFPLLIVIVGLLAYCGTFQVPFVFDDEFNIVNNRAIRGLGALFSPAADRYFPPQRLVGYLTLALNYRMHGLDLAGYHLFNLAIHLANALLVYHLVRLTFRTPSLDGLERRLPGLAPPPVALFAALLFVAHPVQTQAVTYVIQRLASLATFFYLLSLVSYIEARLTGGGRTLHRTLLHLAAIAAAVLAMNTKEIAFTLPLTALCYELLFFKGAFARRFTGLLPLLLTMIIIPYHLLGRVGSSNGLFVDVGEVTRVMTPIPRFDYLITQFRVIVTYLRLLFLPVGLRVDYDYPIYHSLHSPEVLASLTLLLVIAGGAVLVLLRSLSRHSEDHGWGRLVFFAVLWFFLTLSVESSVIPIADVIFEQRLYLPSIGFCLLIPLLLAAWPVRGRILGLSCLVILLAGATYARNRIWSDDVRLWTDNVAKSPHKGRGYVQLGKAYRRAGRDDLAVATYNRWLTLDPNDPEAYNNRGNAYNRLGRPDLALADFTRAIGLDSGLALPYFNRGLLLLDRKEYARALADFQRAAAIDPDQERLYSSLGYAYEELGMHGQAVEAYTRELALRPGSGELYYNRSVAYRRMGRAQESENDLRMARSLGIRK